MTYAEHAARGARVPCTVVEVDLDYIDDVAVTPTNPDGSLCYRTPATTDQGDLPVSFRTLRLITSTQKALPNLPGAIPCLASAKIATEQVKPGRGLGFFGQATISLVDFTDDDRRGEDPFATDASRTGIDLRAGTFLTKLMARNPWWTGRRIRVIEGWATGGVWWPDDTITHHHFVRDVQGPTDGRQTITAAGPLQLLNLDEKEAPLPSEGVLLEDIDEVTTSATFDLSSVAMATIDATYPTSGMLRIGDELVSYSRVTGTAALTITRAQLSTAASTHSAGDTLQLYLSYDDVPLVDILQDLLVTYGGVDVSLLAVAEWADEQAQWLSLYSLSGGISQPTKVLDLVQELLETAACILWWDDAIGQIRLRAVRPSVTPVGTWSDRFHLLSATAIKVDARERVSRTDVLMSMRSPVLDPKVSSSYRVRVLGIEQGAGVTENQSSKVKLLASRWLSPNQVSLAVRASYQMTAQLRDGRKTVVVEVASKDSSREIGDILELLTKDIVDTSGQPKRTRGMVVKREPIEAGSRYRYTLELIPFGGRFAYFTDDPFPMYADATAGERDPGAFFTDAAGGGLGPNQSPYIFG